MTLLSIHRVAAVEVLAVAFPGEVAYLTILRVVTEDGQVTEISLHSANEIKLNDETDN